ncbi:MAG: sulfatase [Pirellulales bacterium]
MQDHSAIVVMVDLLGAGYLGPYGNSWVETPQLNRLASQSWVFEQAISDSTTLPQLYRSFLLGCHAARGGSIATAAGLPLAAAGAGIRAALITDESRLGEYPPVSDFPERIQLAPREPAAAAEEHTQLGQLFSAALDWLDSAESPFLLWLHAQGMNGAWDAPWSYREGFADEEDPRPPDFVVPPNQRVDDAFDPDELLGVTQAYAGQVLLLDVCMGTLMEVLEAHPRRDQTMVVFASPRGFPLGEHGCIGACGDSLRGEVLHMPLMIRTPDGQPERGRISTFAQPSDLVSTISSWLNLSSVSSSGSRNLLDLGAGNASWRRECVCAIGDGQRAIRTPAWFLRETDSGSISLYAKPDDRWEVNEVADRCPEVVLGLRAALHRYLELAEAGRTDDFPPLSRDLLELQE